MDFVNNNKKNYNLLIMSGNEVRLLSREMHIEWTMPKSFYVQYFDCSIHKGGLIVYLVKSRSGHNEKRTKLIIQVASFE